VTTRILIVDDHPAVREGLALRISTQKDLEVCGEAEDITDTLKQLDTARPDVVVVDIQLKTGDGLELVKRIKTRDESIRILVWSVYPDKVYAKRALKAGALGYINKEHSTGRIVDAIRRVSEGRVYLADEIAESLLSHTVRGTADPNDSVVDILSDRELEVFRLLGEGLSGPQVAQRLHLSPHTVDTHRQRIKEKLSLATTTELTQAAIRWTIEGG